MQELEGTACRIPASAVSRHSAGTGSLDLPYYGIGFVDAVKRGFKKYAFTGRASRSEYWWWALFTFTGYLVLGLLAFALGTATSRDGGRTPGLLALPLIILFAVFVFGILIPTLAVTVRRLQRRRIQRAACAAVSSPLFGRADHYDLRLVAELAGWSQVRPGPGNPGS